jgi:prolyl 4-hydroxylase
MQIYKFIFFINISYILMKTTINQEWTIYIKRQIKLKVPLKKLEELLKKNNYSKEIIDNLLYKNNQNQIINKICFVPEIYTIDNFLTDEECNHFIEICKNNLKRAKVTGDNKNEISKSRTNSNNWLRHNLSKITMDVANRISKLVKIPLINAESFQMIHYNKSQEYKNHYDGWEHDKSEKTYRCIKYGGQRIYTCLCYLNDVLEGGSTKFTKIDEEVQPKKGRILVFKNVYDNTNKRHPLTEHAGMPVIKGEKYAFNLWFREESMNIPYKQLHPEYYE